MTVPMVVTLDGPAGAGKSTVARALAARLGLPYLETGAMYRAVAWFSLERGLDPKDPFQAEQAVRDCRLTLQRGTGTAVEVLVNGAPIGSEIRQPAVSLAASQIAVHPVVREQLVAWQRDFLRKHGGVLEGRDTGTHVAPDAPFKFFLDASLDVRVLRRREQLLKLGREVASELVEEEILERDERDRSRAVAPLVPALDAIRIDTSQLSSEQVVEQILQVIRSRCPTPLPTTGSQ